jgi:hypothetical protein
MRKLHGTVMSERNYDYKNFDDSRWQFYESWLLEYPQRIESRYDFPGLLNILSEFISIFGETQVAQNIFKSESESSLYIFGKVDDVISIISYMEKTSQSVKIMNTQKNERFTGTRPNAVDVYLTALEIVKPRSLVFTSDNQMTDKGLEIWKKLLSIGKHVSVYDITDKSRTGQTLKQISSPKEMEQYFTNDRSGQRYRYVLSESINQFNNHTYCKFMTRRICESAGTINDKTYEE